MKTQVSKCMLMAILLIASFKVKSQFVADFENLSLSPNSYWNGSNLSGGFTSGDVYFYNDYDTTWGAWNGFSYSNIIDSTTAGITNQYAARTAAGYNSSTNYVVGNCYGNTRLKLITTALLAGVQVTGFYVTNSTYAAISMRDGDSFSKKFGGTSGNDPDWFKLSIIGYKNGTILPDTISFYLADYRFADSTQDYIVKTWEWIDLSPLGNVNVDSLFFGLSSSDTGSFGMNTPAYFCMDNFTTSIPFSIAENKKDASFVLYPNPAEDLITINFVDSREEEVNMKIMDIVGKIVYNVNVNSSNSLNLNIADLKRGIYFLNVLGNTNNYSQKFIKK